MTRFSTETALNDPSLDALPAVRRAEVRDEATIDAPTILRDLLAFDAEGGTVPRGASRLIDGGEFGAAEKMIDRMEEGDPTVDRGPLRALLASARAEARREYLEQTRLILERLATATRSDAPHALREAAVAVIDAAKDARSLADEKLRTLRERVEGVLDAAGTSIEEQLGRLEAKGALGDDELKRARLALRRGHIDLARWVASSADADVSTPSLDFAVPPPRPWIESTPVKTALRWLSRRSGPPGFIERWGPAEDDPAATDAIDTLLALAECDVPTEPIFRVAASALDRLFGGDGVVDEPTAERGALSVRLPSLRLPSLPWFGPGAQEGGLTVVVPAVSGAGLPASLGPSETALVLRVRYALQNDERAIRLEPAQLIPLLRDPHRAENVWRLLGVRTPLGRLLSGVDDVVGDAGAPEWTEDRARVRSLATSLLDVAGHREVGPDLVDGIVHVTAGIPALALPLMEALLGGLSARSGGRAATIGVDDLRSASWHKLYLDRVWGARLAVLERDVGAQAAFAAVRCAAGSEPTARYRLDLQDVLGWAEMAGLDEAALRAGLGVLQSVGLVDVGPDDAVSGSTSGLALVAARKQGPPEELLESLSSP